LVRSSATGCDDEAERGEHEDDRDSHEYGADHRQELPQDADAAAAAQQAKPRFEAEQWQMRRRIVDRPSVICRP